jgi:hypothetical protein
MTPSLWKRQRRQAVWRTQNPVENVIKLFFFETNAAGKHPILMFASKPGDVCTINVFLALASVANYAHK